ncbi:aspartate--tRNA ligase [bacterium]|nr:aspartate--tRNA ligase [bacterium]
MCGEPRIEHADRTAVIHGWVAKRRDLGQIIFLDVRDRTGVVQAVIDPDHAPAEAMSLAKSVRAEFVVSIVGNVRLRPEGTRNAQLPTGEVEVLVNELHVLNVAEPPPFVIADDVDAGEDTRLRYRYLDLRRAPLQRILMRRHEAARIVRNSLSDLGFLEIETPVLTKSTPEGARDYIVPSRIFPGQFYALPQSPQIFKQLLMVAGFDRYFQIVKCFRDEDLRADRQPEFTQIDIEASFVEREDILAFTEAMMGELLRKAIGHEIPAPLDRISYGEALSRWGSDKPDRRFGLELSDLAGIFAGTEFRVLRGAIDAGGDVRGILAAIPDASRKRMDELTDHVKLYGAAGLVWMKFAEGDWTGGQAKFFSDDEKKRLTVNLSPSEGDTLAIVAGKPKVVFDALGALRLKLGRELGLIDEARQDLFWVIDFPLLEWSEEDGRFYAMHHPFTSPRPDDIGLLDTEPGKALANAYDMVWNGYEIGGGSIRIHRADVQNKMFRALSIGEDEARDKFGFLLDALKYGTPPHGGIALGLDRIVMLLTGTTNIRDVIAFPKTAKASDLMAGCPSGVSEDQLEDLGIRIKKLTTG